MKVASLPNRTFTGRVAAIGSVVEGETRVLPVKAELDNSGGLLKPGMFAEMELLTNQSPTAVLAIPSSGVVEANGKQLVYVQNGNAYQPVEVTLGQTSGDMVEVKSGLFDGDLVVTQRATQLYAQSLRSGREDGEQGRESALSPQSAVPWWLVIPGGGAIAVAAFWAGRRTKPHTTPASAGLAHVAEDSPNGSQDAIHPVSTPASRVGTVSADESSPWIDNHHKPH